MIREIIRPTSEFYNIHIPKEYMHKNVEVIVLPIFELEETDSQIIEKKEFNPKEFYGVSTQSKESIDNYLASSKSEWE